jgi:uncharacterized protein YjiS (DUF1127 family)
MRTNTVFRTAARVAQLVRNTINFTKELRDLNKLSDRELRDMGISRYDVSALAKNMREHPVGR